MLIVVVIIGILAAALIPRLQGAQERSRDLVRKVDIKTTADALAIYYGDNQSFPLAQTPTNCPSDINIPIEGAEVSTCGSGILQLLVPNYLSKQPKDPLHPNKKFPYLYYVNNTRDKNSINNRCNTSANYIVQLLYNSEANLDTDYVRGCPDGQSRDYIVGVAYPQYEKKNQKDWQRGIWIFDDKVLSINPAYLTQVK